MTHKGKAAHGKAPAIEGLQVTLADMEKTFGVPLALLPFSWFAAWPQFVRQAWKNLKPAVETGEFFHAAQRLEADAYTRMFNYFQIPELRPKVSHEGELRGDLAELLELFQIRAALLLLFFSLEAEALEGPTGHSHIPLPPPSRPVFPKLHWVEDEETARDRGRSQGGQAAEGFSFINPEYRLLRRWPDFFHSYMISLSSVVASPLYEDWQLSTGSLAKQLARELPVRVEIGREIRGVTQRDLDLIAVLHDALVENLSELLLNMAVARIGLEKGSTLAPRAAAAPGTSQEKPHRVA